MLVKNLFDMEWPNYKQNIEIMTAFKFKGSLNSNTNNQDDATQLLLVSFVRENGIRRFKFEFQKTKCLVPFRLGIHISFPWHTEEK